MTEATIKHTTTRRKKSPAQDTQKTTKIVNEQSAEKATKEHAGKKHIGSIVSIQGMVVDVFFDGKVPEQLHALRVELEGRHVLLEVQYQLGGQVVRALSITDPAGLYLGAPVVDLREQITAPVGPEVLGRIFNAMGETIDGTSLPKNIARWPVHRAPPPFKVQAVNNQVYYTGIKVIDLMAPFVRGGKVGLFGGAGVGKTSRYQNQSP